MVKRVLTAVVLVVFFILVLIMRNTVALQAAISLVSLIAAYEIMRAYGINKTAVLMVSGLVYSAAFPFAKEYLAGDVVAIIVWVIICIFLVSAVLMHKECSMRQNIPSLFVIVAVPLSLTMFADIIRMENGIAKGVFVCLCAWVTDVFAHLIGSRFGKHKLAPEISKNKTKEGALGGLIGGLLCGILLGVYMNLFTQTQANYFVTAMLGIAGSVIGQLGDLIASKIKRECGIKDFGTILPGHGGVLDRIDSMLFVIPFGYIVFEFLGYLS